MLYFLTQTVTRTGLGVGGTNGTNKPKSYFSLQQKGYKSPQRSENYISAAAHNPEVGGSSPPPVTNKPLKSYDFSGFLCFSSLFCCLFFIIRFDPDSDPRRHKLRIAPLAACGKALSTICSHIPQCNITALISLPPAQSCTRKGRNGQQQSVSC